MALQQERRLSVVHLAGDPQRDALRTQRTRTDEAAAQFRALTQGRDARLAASEQAEQRVDETFARLAEVAATREAIDAGSIDRERAAGVYTDVISAGFRIYGSLATLDDPDVAKDGRTLVAMTRAREVLAQEDTLLAGALAARRITAAEHAKFVELVGTQRYLHAEADAELPPADHDRYQQLLAGPAMTQLRTLEDLVIAEGAGRAPVSAAAWTAAMEPAFVALRELVVAGVDDTVTRATPAAAGVILRLILAGGLGLLAVIASIVMSITTARALVAQLEKLRHAASDLATRRLPGVVDRLRRGEKVDLSAEAPPLAFGSDEVGQVGQAINAVQQTAIRAAVQQAELRDSVRDLFLGLARRNQALVHRQLRVLDEIERRETDPQELADIFRVDHLATRMRRNAENLIVLSGATPGRRWRNPVPMVDVLRGAVAEVEDYTRVDVTPVEGVWLAGRAVSDVIHLLAELIENGTSFSPPYTTVHVGGEMVANGFAIEVEDRGLGMSETELADANELLRNPPDFNLSSTLRLGVYVVGRLAQRHEIDVHLRRSPYGGTTAIVLIPRTLVAPGTDDTEGPHELADNTERPHELADGTDPVAVEVPNTEAEARGGEASAVSNVATTDAGLRHGPASVRPPSRHPAAVAARTDDVASEPASTPTHTPSGLPWRVRQASLAPGLRDTPPAPSTASNDSGRTPEQTREMMTAYQRASQRGRAEANRSLETETNVEPPATDDPAAGGRIDPASGERR